VLDPLDRLELCNSERSSGASKPETGNGADPLTQPNHFQKVVDWLEERGVRAGHPENIAHTYSCKQRCSLKSEEAPRPISLTGSVILLRRSKLSSKEEPPLPILDI
jgi:hypothetical protein